MITNYFGTNKMSKYVMLTFGLAVLLFLVIVLISNNDKSV